MEWGQPVDPVVVVGALDFTKLQATAQDFIIALEMEEAKAQGGIRCVFSCQTRSDVHEKVKQYSPAAADALMCTVRRKPITALILTSDGPSVLHLAD
jgi:hypothetical protein